MSLTQENYRFTGLQRKTRSRQQCFVLSRRDIHGRFFGYGQFDQAKEKGWHESGAEIRHGGNEAFYSVKGDYIQVPERNRRSILTITQRMWITW